MPCLPSFRRVDKFILPIMKVIGILREPEKETRVCITPDGVKRIVRELELDVFVQEDAGIKSGFTNEMYTAAGAVVVPYDELVEKCDSLLSINHMHKGGAFKTHKSFIGIFNLMFHHYRLADYKHSTISVYSLDMVPRTTKAQSMDVLSSMASLSGYKAVIKAAELFGSAIPMFTTAAGTLRPARVLVLGAGVAGLQAIATAKRLGAVVEAFDVRRAAAEEVESLGARFIEVPGYKESASSGGYAITQDADYQQKQKELIAKHIKSSQIVISTANIPGRKAPILIERDAIDHMQPGSVIIDLASEQGGNSELTKDGELIDHAGIKILGDSYLSRELPGAASQLLTSNYIAFLKHLLEKNIRPLNDPILNGSKIVSNGELIHPSFLPKEEPLFV